MVQYALVIGGNYIMKEIKIKNGVLKNFNVNETLAILKIGYTLNEDETGYNNAIIVREGEGNNIITDNEEVIMRFLNLYAMQNEVPLDRIFSDPDIMRLYGNDEDKLSDLLDRQNDIDMLRDDKKLDISLITLASAVSLFSAYLVKILGNERNEFFMAIAGMLLSSFYVGKKYAESRQKSSSIVEMKSELDELINKYGDALLDNNQKRITR